jgi:hypothetical protein
VSVNILRVDELCRASLLRIKGPLRHLTLRLLFRPDQQLDDDDDEEEDDVEGDNPKPTPGDGLARLAQVCTGPIPPTTTEETPTYTEDPKKGCPRVPFEGNATFLILTILLLSACDVCCAERRAAGVV